MTRCRYLRRNEEQCTAEVVDEHGELLICAKHLARAMELLAQRGFSLMPPPSSRPDQPAR